MKIAQIVILATLIPILISAYLIAKFVFKKNINSLFCKIFVSILGIIFFIRYMSGDDLISNTISGMNNIFESSAMNYFAIFLVWFTYASILLVCFQPFFKIKNLNNLVKYFVLPFSIIAVFSIQISTKAILGANAYEENSFRGILMALELALMLPYAFMIFIENNNFKMSKVETRNFFLSIIPVLLTVIPSYFFQAFFGLPISGNFVKEFNFNHRLVLYGAVILPILIYYGLRKQNQEVTRFALLYICIGTLLSYSLYKKFDSFVSITGLPLHLCNTAMYILPLCLLFKWNKLFYFTYFINVFGAFIAMMMPNYSDGANILSESIINFYVNHYIAFFMPILMVSLKMFPRPKLKQFIYSMVAFVVYFVLIVIINAWFSNYGSVDYFFVNSDFVAEKLGQWAEDLRNIVWTFNIGSLTFVLYPLYQFLFMIVYMLIGLCVWFVFEQCYQIADVHQDMRNRSEKIRLDCLALQIKNSNMSEEEKMSRANSKATIRLNHFTKRYGNSDVYAVKDAVLEINGGEIFGFLGPNGAGKSTIIKSIVGIQPITEGSIEVCGYDVEKESVLAKKEIGFVPDHYALYEKLTGREYINYIADLYEVGLEERNKAIEKYVKLFELQGAFDNQMKTYSHGMKQKITIIAALVHNPKVWILDEPLTGLDPTSIFQVKECMKQHAKEGNIVFFSSHIIDVVERICDRIAIIKKGQILLNKPVDEIEKSGVTLEDFYMEAISNGNNQAIKVEKEKKNKTKNNIDSKNAEKKTLKEKIKNLFKKKSRKTKEDIVENDSSKQEIEDKNEKKGTKNEKNKKG